MSTLLLLAFPAHLCWYLLFNVLGTNEPLDTEVHLKTFDTLRAVLKAYGLNIAQSIFVLVSFLYYFLSDKSSNM